MSACSGNFVYEELSDLDGQELHLLFGHVLQIFGKIVFCKFFHFT